MCTLSACPIAYIGEYHRCHHVHGCVIVIETHIGFLFKHAFIERKRNRDNAKNNWESYHKSKKKKQQKNDNVVER